MATSPEPRTSTSAPGSLRLRLDSSPEHGAPDGVWWPRSRDLQVEAADLVDHLPAAAGHINRLVFSRPDWDDAVVDGRGVRKIYAARGPVKVGSFPSDDTHLMILVMGSGQHLRLLVLPSSTSAVEGERRLAAPSARQPRGEAATSPAGSDWARWDNESPGT